MTLDIRNSCLAVLAPARLLGIAAALMTGLFTVVAPAHASACSVKVFCPDTVTSIKVPGVQAAPGYCRTDADIVAAVVARCPAPPGCSMWFLHKEKVLGGDGCSGPVAKEMVDAGVLPACHIHDMCYSFPGADKAKCDLALGHHRNVICTGVGCANANWQEATLLTVPRAHTSFATGQHWADGNCRVQAGLGAAQVDAAVNWSRGVTNSGKAYLFQGNRYGRYDLQGSAGYDSGFPKATGSQWKLPAAWNGRVDAAVNWGNGVAYLFHDTEYVRYDLNASAPGERKDTQSNWHFPASWGGRVDAAVNWGDGSAYFFSGTQFVKYDLNASVPGKVYNTSGWNLPMSWGNEVDAAINWGNGVAYLFKGDQYVRYPIGGTHPDYPAKGTLANWKIPAK